MLSLQIPEESALGHTTGAGAVNRPAVTLPSPVTVHPPASAPTDEPGVAAASPLAHVAALAEALPVLGETAEPPAVAGNTLAEAPLTPPTAHASGGVTANDVAKLNAAMTAEEPESAASESDTAVTTIPTFPAPTLPTSTGVTVPVPTVPTTTVLTVPAPTEPMTAVPAATIPTIPTLSEGGPCLSHRG
jgi:hypothetical protein